jgi:hypothetical protein
MEELYLYSPTSLHGVVLNYLSSGITFPYFTTNNAIMAVQTFEAGAILGSQMMCDNTYTEDMCLFS